LPFYAQVYMTACTCTYYCQYKSMHVHVRVRTCTYVYVFRLRHCRPFRIRFRTCVQLIYHPYTLYLLAQRCMCMYRVHTINSAKTLAVPDGKQTQSRQGGERGISHQITATRESPGGKLCRGWFSRCQSY